MSTTGTSAGSTSAAGAPSPPGAAPPSAADSPGVSSGPPPVTLADISARIGEVRDEVASWFAGLPLDRVFRRAPGAWAPLDDLRHLVRVNAALVKGLGYPAPVLRMRFGRPARKAWSYERLAVLYDALLTTGVKSPEPFEPRSDVVVDPEAYRDRVLERWRSVNAELLARVGRLTERRADRTALPHPGLGLLSVREMLFFTIHHDLHHLGVAKGRVREAASPGRGSAISSGA